MSRLRRWSGKGLRVLAIAAPLAAVSSCGGSVEKGKEQDSVSGLEGELAMQAGVALDGSRFVRHALRTPDGREIELEFEQAPDLRAGVRLRIEGEPAASPATLGGEKLRVRDYVVIQPKRTLGTARQPLIEHGPRQVAAILVHWSEPGSFGTEQVEDLLFNNPTSAAALFAEASFGKVTFQGEAFGWFEIDAPVGCDTLHIAAQASAAAEAAEIDLGEYDHVAYVFNGPDLGCFFAGLGNINTPSNPARETWYNTFLSEHVFAHELGHNLGFIHGHAYHCPAAIGTRQECEFDRNDIAHEYGDPFDTMGSGATHFNAYHKAAQNWFTGCNAVTTSKSGVFEIDPIELSTTGIQALRIPMSAALCPVEFAGPCYYYLERRRPVGAFDSVEPYSTSAMIDGVLVHAAWDLDVTGSTPLTGSFLLDTTPDTAPFPFSRFWDASLTAGRAFGDPTGVRVRVLSESPSSVRVAVKVPEGTGPISCIDGTQLPSPANCSDGLLTGDESDVDCGGSLCVPCDDGKVCSIDADCWSDNCASGVCQPACDDGAKNGDETDIDCGGSCGACADGLICAVFGDCRSGACQNGRCSSNQLLATLTVHSDWQTGFCGQVSLENVASTPTVTWSLDVNFEDSTLTSSSGGIFTPSGGGVYTVTPDSWAHVIWPSSFATVSFCADKTGPNYFPELLFTTVQY